MNSSADGDMMSEFLVQFPARLTDVPACSELHFYIFYIRTVVGRIRSAAFQTVTQGGRLSGEVKLKYAI